MILSAAFTEQREQQPEAVERNSAANNTSRAKLRFEQDYFRSQQDCIADERFVYTDFSRKSCQSHEEQASSHSGSDRTSIIASMVAAAGRGSLHEKGRFQVEEKLDYSWRIGSFPVHFPD